MNVKAGSLYPSEAEARFVSLFCGPKAAVNIYFRLYDPSVGDEGPRGRAMVALESPEDVTSLREFLMSDACGLHREDEPDRAAQKFRRRCNVSATEDTDYGYRQFSMWDLDENEIMFFAFLSSDE